MRFLGYITVRLNSRRVPQKSIRTVGGKPLINYAVSTLNKVHSISEVVLYASQKRVMDYVDSQFSYSFIDRPPHLDSDGATFNDILESVVHRLDTDYIVFLSATSPFIRPGTIQDMIDHIENGEYDSAFAAHKMLSFCWYDGRPLNYDPALVPRTQDLMPITVETSGLYVFSKSLFIAHRRRIGFKPYIRDVDVFEGWDIDTVDDLEMASLIAGRERR